MTSRDRLDDWLDGTLDDAERDAFEQRLADDADLADEVRRQRAVDDELRRAFAPPPGLGERIADTVRASAADEQRRPSPVIRWPLPAAAAVLAALAGGILWSLDDGTSPPSVTSTETGAVVDCGDHASMGPHAHLDAGALYSDLVARTEVDPASCVAHGSLEEDFFSRYGEHLAVAPELELSGPFDIDRWSDATGWITADATPRVLVVGEAARDPGLTAPADGRLEVHRQQLGSLVVYEISMEAVSCLSVFELDEDADADETIGNLPAER